MTDLAVRDTSKVVILIANCTVGVIYGGNYARTAFDIAGKGIADATSMKAAIQLAVELVKRRYKV